MEMVVNRFKIAPHSTTAMELVEEVQKDQFALMQHAHTSIPAIVAALKRGDEGATVADAECFQDVLRRQLFNWFSNIER